jgi:hypothetical protein
MLMLKGTCSVLTNVRGGSSPGMASHAAVLTRLAHLCRACSSNYVVPAVPTARPEATPFAAGRTLDVDAQRWDYYAGNTDHHGAHHTEGWSDHQEAGTCCFTCVCFWSGQKLQPADPQRPCTAAVGVSCSPAMLCKPNAPSYASSAGLHALVAGDAPFNPSSAFELVTSRLVALSWHCWGFLSCRWARRRVMST